MTLYKSSLGGQRTERALLVVYGSSGWEVSALEVVTGPVVDLDSRGILWKTEEDRAC